MPEPIRVLMRHDEALVVDAALRYWRDTFISEDDAGDADLERARFLAEKVHIRVHRAMRRRGWPVFTEE